MMDITKCTPKYWIENTDACKNDLKNNWNSIKLLNANAIESIGNNTLVRFRGMIQDMYNPEYYYERYEVMDQVTKQVEVRCGKYQDAVVLGDNEQINDESTANVTADRNTFVVITVPALNEWSKSIEKEKNRCDLPIANSARMKRTIDESESSSMDVDPPTIEKNKKLKCINLSQRETNHSVPLSKDYILNFPIPNEEDAMTCLIKVYENGDGTMKLNEMYEFVGFLSINPMTFTRNEEIDDVIDLEMEMHNPPTSLVPRIHCVSWKKLEHNNPLLDLQEIDLNGEKEMLHTFQELHMLFTQLLLGDSLAASYTIYHLLSEVYLRRNMTPLGKFTLNISNIPTEIDNYGEKLNKFIKQLVVKSHYLPMTLDNLNTLTFTPKKDYECNRLTSGLLQLSKNTNLILDETKLKEGKLNEAGVRCVSAITEVINNQNVKYDFVYYQMDYECDIPILIISEGKSMLPSDFHVRLQPNDEYVNTFDEILVAVGKLLNSEVLYKLRIYLTAARFSKYNMSDNVQEIIQDEFVNLRKQYNCSITDLHQLLVLARLICLAEGESNLNESIWKKALEMEKRRKERL